MKGIYMFVPVPSKILDSEVILSKSELDLIGKSLIEACKELSVNGKSQESVEFFNAYANKCLHRIALSMVIVKD